MGDRVAPRCTYAETVLMVSLRRNGISTEKNLTMPDHSLHDLCDLLIQNRVDTLVCGGITRENKKFLEARNLDIIDNVACSVDEIIKALRKGSLRPGYGFHLKAGAAKSSEESDVSRKNNDLEAKKNGPEKKTIDCLACLDRICQKGEACHAELGTISRQVVSERELVQMLEAAADIACENERTLCRLSELIYFCLEMKYRRIGVAYCTDLAEAAEILVRVLRRFFEVIPVCCKIGGIRQTNPLRPGKEKSQNDSKGDISCNPWGQAKVLNHLKTDLNVLVGVCTGADCVFMQGSQAPVTTLFVKDKSLANNPIGALYSDYYLKEAVQTRTGT